MKKLLLIIAVVMVAAIAVSMATCGRHNAAPHSRLDRTVPIGHILSSPQTYADQTICIKGTVSDSFGAFGSSWFVLTDRTGSIHVHGRHYLSPEEGEELKVEGVVKQRFRIKDYNGVVFKITEN